VLKPQSDYVDLLPASYHFYEVVSNRRRRRVADPSKDVHEFLESELSLRRLDELSEYLWLAGARRPPTQLHLQVALGRNIVLADRIDLHLLWNGDGRIFVKPIPRFLLSPEFWRTHLSCVEHCRCFCNSREIAAARDASIENHPTTERRQSPITCKDHLRKAALGFLYTYACLVSTESDFHIAVEKRLLPREPDDSTITWTRWQYLVRELIAQHHPDKIHPRFLRAELRLSRINAIHRTSKLLFAQAYFGGWNNYSSFFRDNLAWIAAITAYMVLILTAMQVGLSTEHLQNSHIFQRASYAFTLLAILGPIGLVSLLLLRAVIELLRDLLVIFKQERAQITSSA
jgi:hypothetical protein